MNLRELAESDLAFMLEDGANGFGWAITLIDPNDVSLNLTGYSNDIGAMIDPDTGQAVSGRTASVELRISSLNTLPVGIANSNSKPWVVKFDDLQLNTHTFKVSQTMPDRALGVVTCMLENYKTV